MIKFIPKVNTTREWVIESTSIIEINTETLVLKTIISSDSDGYLPKYIFTWYKVSKDMNRFEKEWCQTFKLLDTILEAKAAIIIELNEIKIKLDRFIL